MVMRHERAPSSFMAATAASRAGSAVTALDPGIYIYTYTYILLEYEQRKEMKAKMAGKQTTKARKLSPFPPSLSHFASSLSLPTNQEQRAKQN